MRESVRVTLATFDAANFVQCGVRPFSQAYRLLRPYLVYLQVKDALAATGEVVPAGQGDGQVRPTLAALRDSGFDGFVSLEPHLAQAGRYGGFSGPEGFARAAQALKSILNDLAIPFHLGGAGETPAAPDTAVGRAEHRVHDDAEDQDHDHDRGGARYV